MDRKTAYKMVLNVSFMYFELYHLSFLCLLYFPPANTAQFPEVWQSEILI